MNEFKVPRPGRRDFPSDEKYLKALRSWKAQRTKWINEMSSKDHVAKESLAKIKKRKQYRTMKDSEFRKKQKESIKQVDLFNEEVDE
jgi:hypothetical protein